MSLTLSWVATFRRSTNSDKSLIQKVDHMKLTRRQTLFSGAALPLVAAPSLTLAAGHAATSMPTHRDFTLGDFRVTTLLVGSRSVENPHQIFGLNVDDETFRDVSTANFLPPMRHSSSLRLRSWTPAAM